MADVTAMRLQLAAQIDLVPMFGNEDGEMLRTSELELAKINPPVAMIGLDDSQWGATEGGGVGMDRIPFKITLVVSRADARSGQNALDAYLATEGPYSIKYAIEHDSDGLAKLDGLCDRIRASGHQNYGFIEIGGVIFLGAEILAYAMCPGPDRSSR